MRSLAGGVLRRSAIALACAVTILGAVAPARAQIDPVRVSIAAPSLATGTGGHLFELEGDPPPSDDAALSTLVLTDTDTGNAIELELAPAFSRDVLDYAAVVAASVQSITVDATVNHSGAMLKYMNEKEGMLSDLDPDTDGFQAGLIAGTTVVKVQVEAESGMKQIYAVNVTRPGPPFSLTVDTVAGDGV